MSFECNINPYSTRGDFLGEPRVDLIMMFIIYCHTRHLLPLVKSQGSSSNDDL